MFDKKKTALLVIDMQNDNMSVGGKSEKSGAVEHAKKQHVVEHIASLINMAHDNNMPVFHNQFVVKDGAPGVGTNAPIFESITEIGSVVDGSWGGNFVDGIEVAPEDFVLKRTRMSAFNGTQLDILLKNLGIENVIVTGVWTNMAVEHTCRDAADFGYKVTVVTDGTSTINDEWQKAAMDYAMNNIATKKSTQDILNEMKA
ncbi:isochorismatase family cysteine hydrolase [Lactobacillus sp.]|uniref:cysteine hydrolase family protein n=1 Tax=Lactobacillus sp. TaxID=1591 RepID=UPI0019B6D0F0|nr:isochorismatase family cysteine hydrolase [Lactobacillus sp.]MBD5430208.1 cysteine hydrolase [Lactobacillus sp.]